MKNNHRLLSAAIPLIWLLAGCCHKPSEVSGYRSFYLPSSNYKVGQVWAIYTSPRKIDIELDPSVPESDILTSTHLKITKAEEKSLVANATVGLLEKLSARLGVASTSAFSVSYDNARACEVTKSKLYHHLVAHLKANPSTTAYLRDVSTNDPVKLDIATHILIADIILTIDKSLVGESVAELSHVAEGMDLSVTADGSTTEEFRFEGISLAVAYHSDPKFLNRIFRALPQE